MAVAPLRVLVDVVPTWVVQVVSLKSLKVTVPVGLEPPETVAVSVTGVPSGPPAEAWVAMAGLAFSAKA
ncbi:MAG: hypothetical protein ACRD2W_04600 [Acidimicrobiales bacterium]